VISPVSGRITTVSGPQANITGVIELNSDGSIKSIQMDSTETFTISASDDPASEIGDLVIDPSDPSSLFAVGGEKLALSDFLFTPADPAVTALQIIDSQGNEHEITMKFTKLANNQWRWEVDSPNLETPGAAYGKITFTSGGTVQNVTYFDASGNVAS